MYWGTCQGSFSRHSSLQMVVEYIRISPRVSLHTIWSQGDGAGLHKQRLYREPPRLPSSPSHPFFPPWPALAVPHVTRRVSTDHQHCRVRIDRALLHLIHKQLSALTTLPPHPTRTATYFRLLLAHPFSRSLCLTFFTLLVTISFLLNPKSSYYRSPPSGSTHLLASHRTPQDLQYLEEQIQKPVQKVHIWIQIAPASKLAKLSLQGHHHKAAYVIIDWKTSRLVAI